MSPTTAPAAGLDLDDIQGIIARGYRDLPAAAYLLLRVDDPAAARRWLGGLAVTPASGRPEGDGATALHVALTATGLEALGLPRELVERFSREFYEGMVTPHRQRLLGDQGDVSPDGWDWGGPDRPVHLLLMLYAADGPALEARVGELRAGFAAGGVAELRRLDTVTLPERKEHFGFHDGIAQPQVKGLSGARGAPSGNVAADGEFVLGYDNEYGRRPDSPVVPAETDRAGLLEDGAAIDGTPGRDLGRNGSYLVFRQLEQDVHGFWRFMDRRAGADARRRVQLASKMVGRWPNGAPLTLFPHVEPRDPDPDSLDSFSYAEDDRHGDGCPVASHIRRTNPRDSLAPDPAESTDVSRKHRILRRGRSYGAPAAASMHPEDVLAAGPDGVPRGLHFICFNTDIARQFEFVQHTWANNPKFEGLYGDPDPIAASRPAESECDFSVPACPVRHRVREVPRFVRVRGGAYFFLPGIRALRYLANLA